jgi:hypothetical protein
VKARVARLDDLTADQRALVEALLRQKPKSRRP